MKSLKYRVVFLVLGVFINFVFAPGDFFDFDPGSDGGPRADAPLRVQDGSRKPDQDQVDGNKNEGESFGGNQDREQTGGQQRTTLSTNQTSSEQYSGTSLPIDIENPTQQKPSSDQVDAAVDVINERRSVVSLQDVQESGQQKQNQEQVEYATEKFEQLAVSLRSANRTEQQDLIVRDLEEANMFPEDIQDALKEVLGALQRLDSSEIKARTKSTLLSRIQIPKNVKTALQNAVNSLSEIEVTDQSLGSAKQKLVDVLQKIVDKIQVSDKKGVAFDWNTVSTLADSNLGNDDKTIPIENTVTEIKSLEQTNSSSGTSASDGVNQKPTRESSEVAKYREFFNRLGEDGLNLVLKKKMSWAFYSLVEKATAIRVLLSKPNGKNFLDQMISDYKDFQSLSKKTKDMEKNPQNYSLDAVTRNLIALKRLVNKIAKRKVDSDKSLLSIKESFTDFLAQEVANLEKSLKPHLLEFKKSNWWQRLSVWKKTEEISFIDALKKGSYYSFEKSSQFFNNDVQKDAQLQQDAKNFAQSVQQAITQSGLVDQAKAQGLVTFVTANPDQVRAAYQQIQIVQKQIQELQDTNTPASKIMLDVAQKVLPPGKDWNYLETLRKQMVPLMQTLKVVSEQSRVSS